MMERPYKDGKWRVNENDNDNILFDHNIQIKIIMYNSFENQIIDSSGDYY